MSKGSYASTAQSAPPGYRRAARAYAGRLFADLFLVLFIVAFSSQPAVPVPVPTPTLGVHALRVAVAEPDALAYSDTDAEPSGPGPEPLQRDGRRIAGRRG